MAPVSSSSHTSRTVVGWLGMRVRRVARWGRTRWALGATFRFFSSQEWYTRRLEWSSGGTGEMCLPNTSELSHWCLEETDLDC